jgi:acyl transferase domain-containing protein/thioesterase domain-containing protein
VIPDSAIAVVGCAGRFPGARDLATFWDNLVHRRSSITRFTRRQLVEAGYRPEVIDRDDFVAAAGALDGLDEFDARFFGYSRGEAELLDPQQRLFLQCAWAALEGAGHPPGRAEPLRAGVFASSTASRYLRTSVGADQAADLDLAVGNDLDFVATRVSYELNLSGPSLTVQTACSSSLVAVHLACQSLLAGECDLAVAGGVTLQIPRVGGVVAQEGGYLSRDGECRPFDARASGTVGGSGVGAVALRRLADALADGDPIRAIIRGSAINNDGSRKAGLAAPSVSGQVAVICDALAVSEVEPRSIAYVEAHGTGTPIGDPIEVSALTQAFGEGLAPRSCALGAVKSNVGHLDAAAGIAGLVKVVLAIENGVIPPTCHFERPNPHIDFAAGPFYVPEAAVPWPADRTPRRAGVSSFGLGGTNVHVVLEQAPDPCPEENPPRPAGRAQVVVVSARTEAALAVACRELADHLEATDPPLDDVAFTLQTRRRRFAARWAVTAASSAEVVGALRRLRPADVVVDEREDRPAALLFPGAGGQRVGMAADLYRDWPIFRAEVDRCARLLAGELDGDLRATLFPGPDQLDRAVRSMERPLHSQPAIFVFQYAMARALLSLGVDPAVLCGHSVGEYAAACLAGVFSVDGALRLVMARARILERMPPGAMVSVGLSPAEVEPLLGPDLAIAVINGERRTVVSGPVGEVARLEAELSAAAVDVRRVPYPRAAHSRMLDPFLREFERAIADVPLSPPIRPVLSNLSGGPMGDEAAATGYWVRHLRETVRFSDNLAAMLDDPDRVLVDLGPGSALASLARQHPGYRASHAVVSMVPPPAAGGAAPSSWAGVARLWVAGVDLELAALHGERRRCLALPTYPFERHCYWLERQEGAERPHPGPEGSARPPVEPVAVAPDHAAGGAPAGTALGSTAERLRDLYQALFRAPRIDAEASFFALGGDSHMALRLTAAIDRELGVRLPLAAVLASPTVVGLAAHIDGLTRAKTTSSPPREPEHLVPLAADRSGPPIYLIHAAGGEILFYRALADALAPHRVLAIEPRGLHGDVAPDETIEAMARHCLAVIDGAPAGPAAMIAGASFGGMVGFEIARLLADRGDPLPAIAMFDSPGPGHLATSYTGDEDALFAGQLDPGLGLTAGDFRGLGGDERFEKALAVARRLGRPPPFEDLVHARRLFRIHVAAIRAMLAYRGAALDGRLLFLRASETAPDLADLPASPEQAWIPLARRGVEVQLAAGTHYTMIQPPHVNDLAARMRRYLARELAAERG